MGGLGWMGLEVETFELLVASLGLFLGSTVLTQLVLLQARQDRPERDDADDGGHEQRPTHIQLDALHCLYLPGCGANPVVLFFEKLSQNVTCRYYNPHYTINAYRYQEENKNGHEFLSRVRGN